MPLCLEVSVHWRRIKAGVAPKTNAPSEDSNNHQYKWQQDPLGGSPASQPKKSNEWEFWRDDLIVFGINLDDVGDGVASEKLFPLLSRSVRIRRGHRG